jgi:GNAT superfamily N-acetyltransferase
MLVVREIEPKMLYDIRHSILRPHQPFEACIYDTDHDKDAFHIGAFYENKLISIASFYKEKHPDLSYEIQYRLRAMATLPEHRKLGAGRAVVEYAEKRMEEKKAELLWCMGRTNVQEYYEKLGFQAFGEVFDYPPIGPHIVMYKELAH